jgi:hypothetical protein
MRFEVYYFTLKMEETGSSETTDIPNYTVSYPRIL